MKIKTKYYLEEYAKLMMIYKFDFDESTLIHADSPDIQDDFKKIGIEVVEDTYESEKELERFWVEYGTTPFNDIPTKIIDGYYKRGGSLSVSNNKLSGGSLGITKNNSPEHLILTIEKKLNKLNGGLYKSFNYYMLYVFTDTVSLFDSHVQMVINKISSSSQKVTFDKIILDGYFELCICDVKSSSFERYEIDKKVQNQISIKALENSIDKK